MTREQFQRVKALFAELEAVPPPQRRAALGERCDDAAVRAEGATFGQVFPLMAPLVVIATVSFAASGWAFRRKLA